MQKTKKISLFSGVSIVGIATAMIPYLRGPVEIEIGIITFYLTSISILFAFLVSILAIVTNKKHLPANYTDISVLSVCMLYFVSTFLSENIADSGYIAFNALFMPALIYFTLRILVSNHDEYMRVFVFFVLGMTLGGLFRILYTLEAMQRVDVMGLSPIGGAGLATVSILLTYYTLFKEGIIWKVITLINIIALLCTVSRVYLVIILASFVLIKLVKAGKSLLIITAFFVCGLIMTALLAYNADLFYTEGHDKTQERSMERVVNPDFWSHSLYGRALAYHAAFERFEKSPIVGNGFDRSHKVNHSLHAEWLEYGGIIGYLVYLHLFLAHFARVKRASIKDKYVAATTLAIIVVLTNSLFNPFTLGVAPFLVFILMAMNECRLSFTDSNKSQEIVVPDIDQTTKYRVILKGKKI